MTTRWLSVVLCAATVVLTAAACAPFRAPVNPNALHDHEQVIFLGFANIATTSAVRAKADRLPGGNLRVRAQFVKEAFGSAFVEIQTTFVDDSGFQVEQTNWEPFHFHIDTIAQYETVSIGTTATDFRLVVRRAPEPG